MLSVSRAMAPSLKNRRRVHGIALIESLVSLLVLALGVMSLAGVQFRLLAENRVSNQRAVAIGLIDDMANRILNNKDEALAGAYSVTWEADVEEADCAARPCNADQLAQADIYAWKKSISVSLPGGSANVFISPNDSRQIGIAVAWLTNESSAKDLDAAVYARPFNLTTDNSGTDCPVEYICHLVYVQP